MPEQTILRSRTTAGHDEDGTVRYRDLEPSARHPIGNSHRLASLGLRLTQSNDDANVLTGVCIGVVRKTEVGFN